MIRKSELFEIDKLSHSSLVNSTPRHMFPQERDWTCAIACIRTLISGLATTVPSEDKIIQDFNIQPGALYSKDIKDLKILWAYDAIYGCDKPNITFDDIIEYMDSGRFVMIECLYNYAHWLVLLGYYPSDDCNIEHSRLLVYDPYYDCVRLEHTDEVMTMWIDGNFTVTNVQKDFIAI